MLISRFNLNNPGAVQALTHRRKLVTSKEMILTQGYDYQTSAPLLPPPARAARSDPASYQLIQALYPPPVFKASFTSAMYWAVEPPVPNFGSVIDPMTSEPETLTGQESISQALRT